jgi:hypothetical protein
MSSFIVSKIKNLFKKEIMENNTETAQEVKRFQWKKGDHFGKVVEVESEDSEFYIFTDGTQIFKSVATEFLEKVDDINNLPFPSTTVISPSNKNEAKSVKEEAPKIIQSKVSAPVEKSPLENLIIKLSSKNVETLKLNLGVNLPKREVFDMLLENSDESRDEMIKTISQVVTSQIQIDKLQSYIYDEVTLFLNNYYNESNS